MPAPPMPAAVSNGQPRPVTALIEEKFHPGLVNVIAPDRQPPGTPVLLVQLLVGEISPPTSPMAVFVTAFSLMADALRDALDPKLRGLE